MTGSSPELDKIFFIVNEIESEEARAAYLDEACGGDVELRSRVERMLAAQSQVNDFLEKPPAELDVAMGSQSGNGEEPDDQVKADVTESFHQESDGPGTVIGPYKLLQKIVSNDFQTVRSLVGNQKILTVARFPP